MSLVKIREIFQCPKCSNRVNQEGFPDQFSCVKCKHRFPVVQNNICVASSTIEASEDWKRKQADSVERYEHVEYNHDTTIPRIFGGFMSLSPTAKGVFLDVGCGLSPNLPAYVDELKPSCYIGIEPISKPVDRNYACLTGVLCEEIPLQDDSVDVVCFATSLDHIENVDKAISEVKRILKPNGRIFIWTGIYESEMLAAKKTFHNLAYRGSFGRRVFRYLFVNFEYTHLLWKMHQLNRRMKKGIPLDNVHERYYTRESILEDMQRWGLFMTRSLVVPASQSFFIEATRIKAM